MTQENMNPGKERRQRNWWRRIAISVSVAVVLVLFGASALANNTQIVVGFFQGYQSQNSFEPIFDDFSTATKILVGNYIDGTIHPSESERNRYNPIESVNALYPASFLIGSNYGGDGYAHDMEQLANALKTHDVRHDFIYERRADGSQANHGLLGGLSTGDHIAVDAFNRMIAFMNSTRKP